MRSKDIILVLTILTSCILFNVKSEPTIAIVGAGIGGTSCSYYLYKQQPNLITSTTIFEARNYVGGRIDEIEFGGQIEEIGADAWSNVNFYIQQLAADLQLDVINSTSNSTYSGNGMVGIWGSDGFVQWEKIAAQSPKVDKCVQSQIDQFITDLAINYAEREIYPPFQSINEFLSYGDLIDYQITNFSKYLDECNTSEEYQNTLIAPIVRAIYDQSVNYIQSFAGEVSLVSIYTPAYWVNDGNSLLPKSMVERSGVEVKLNTQVTEITWDGTRYQLFTSSTDDYHHHNNMDGSQSSSSSFEADIVVIAAPIEKTAIRFNNISFSSNITERQFVRCYVTHVEATAVNPVYFGLSPSSIAPDFILTTPQSLLPFTQLGVEDESLTTEGAKIYKLFSNVDITINLQDIFLNVSDFHVHEWQYTFPELIPTEEFQPVELATNLIYLNTIESAASAMEASVISGRNAAHLILKSLGYSY